ncbi:Protein AE7 [Babesia sp. Xinjiang]|uniref:Protein AE7 n=1 Tax=Babesia sp. Xinjiang TaxID=462227 RepID=UPI000A2555F6|nr:Protein AE7 [Babesia sp. Xinjiang]ORM39987.1 Protein AE7 [Babesia sp. Xinjiang]
MSMDNANPVVYKRSSSLTTTDSQKRLLDNENAQALFHIDTTLLYEQCDRKNVDTSGPNDLFSPSTDFEPFEVSEIFDMIRNIKDPEYSYTLETLKIVEEESIHIDQENYIITVHFTPTVPHCSQATIIGLMIYVKLLQSLPPQFKIDVQITEGSHNSEGAINKQLLDKERVAAALENPVLVNMINDGIYNNED